MFELSERDIREFRADPGFRRIERDLRHDLLNGPPPALVRPLIKALVNAAEAWQVLKNVRTGGMDRWLEIESQLIEHMNHGMAAELQDGLEAHGHNVEHPRTLRVGDILTSFWELAGLSLETFYYAADSQYKLRLELMLAMMPLFKAEFFSNFRERRRSRIQV